MYANLHATALNSGDVPRESVNGSVLVVGAGIAGVVAAIEAARGGAHVKLACAGRLFGGSSFYPGTWGLGLIGPVDELDEDDLIETIIEVGCGVADPDLVEAFVRGIRPAIAWLEDDLGVELKQPASAKSAGETAFVPCFDHKHRLWRGITREEFTAAARAEIKRLGIEVLERCELMGLLDAEGSVLGNHAEGSSCASSPRNEPSAPEEVRGALLFDHAEGSFRTVRADAVVLAAGGTSGLFERSLTSADVLSSVHDIALDAGCELINIEFMQMMPGLVAPKRGLVFNEKTFRYARFRDGKGILPSDGRVLAELLETRSGHGPFTARLGDAAVDLAIDAAGPDGIAVTYDFPTSDIPEFVQTFATWLEREHGISPSDELRVAMYAHASNGGICITPDAETGVPGLFACGEVTGGMHGADRLGGLSSANGLVFGRRAGRSAAAHAAKNRLAGGACASNDGGSSAPGSKPPQISASAPSLSIEDARVMTRRLKRLMSTYAMINRTDEGLARALSELDILWNELRAHSLDNASQAELKPAGIARGLRMKSQLALARAMLSAMRARTVSLGSHFRVDRGTEAKRPRCWDRHSSDGGR